MKKAASKLPGMDSEENVSQLADLFSLMGDTSRLRIILCCLHEAISVSDIASQLGLSQSLVSHHLRLLKAARMVKSERRGKQVFYTAADQHVQCVIEDMVAHISEPANFGDS
ncbi:MAG: metalloregulator ArsR/SmtB family transcription factor [Acidiferrobacterales bacterium]|nr:metalloregulator ArsR/SmtB family transcription factor [Acidiferrobacterales bacterium]